MYATCGQLELRAVACSQMSGPEKVLGGAGCLATGLKKAVCGLSGVETEVEWADLTLPSRGRAQHRQDAIHLQNALGGGATKEQ